MQYTIIQSLCYTVDFHNLFILFHWNIVSFDQYLSNFHSISFLFPPSLQALTSIILFSSSYEFKFLDSKYKLDHEILFSFCAQFFSLSIVSYRVIHSVENDKISFFFLQRMNIILLHIDTIVNLLIGWCQHNSYHGKSLKFLPLYNLNITGIKGNKNAVAFPSLLPKKLKSYERSHYISSWKLNANFTMHSHTI